MSLAPQDLEKCGSEALDGSPGDGSATVGSSRLKPLTAIILTFNEEIHIERAVRSAQQVAAKVYVVDSFSTDRTVEVAKSAGAIVVQNSWKNYADQFQWALDHCDVSSEWVLRLDADEYLDDELIADLTARLPAMPADVTGILVRLKVIFQGRWLRFGGLLQHLSAARVPPPCRPDRATLDG